MVDEHHVPCHPAVHRIHQQAETPTAWSNLERTQLRQSRLLRRTATLPGLWTDTTAPTVPFEPVENGTGRCHTDQVTAAVAASALPALVMAVLSVPRTLPFVCSPPVAEGVRNSLPLSRRRLITVCVNNCSSGPSAVSMLPDCVPTTRPTPVAGSTLMRAPVCQSTTGTADCICAFTPMPNAQIQSAVPVVDWQTGALIRVEPATGVGLVVGTQSGNMLTAEGPLLQLFTQTVINRRLLRGRLFLTPSATGGLQTNGSVLGTLSTAITNAGNALAATAAVTWSVWHRPVPFSTGSNGTVGAVVSVQSP